MGLLHTSLATRLQAREQPPALKAFTERGPLALLKAAFMPSHSDGCFSLVSEFTEALVGFTDISVLRFYKVHRSNKCNEHFLGTFTLLLVTQGTVQPLAIKPREPACGGSLRVLEILSEMISDDCLSIQLQGVHEAACFEAFRTNVPTRARLFGSLKGPKRRPEGLAYHSPPRLGSVA